MTEYTTILVGGSFDGMVIKFPVNKTPTSIRFDKESYYRRIKKLDPEGEWKPENLQITFVKLT